MATTDAEVYTQYLGPTGSLATAEKLWNDIGNVILVTTGHYSVGYSHWCHTCLSIELSWSNYCVARWKLFCDDDPFKLPFDVFGSHNSYADTIDSDTAPSDPSPKQHQIATHIAAQAHA
eukprot:g78447.t1